MSKTYKQLNKEERHTLEILLRRGESQKSIALALNRDKSTISREVWRNKSRTALFYLGLRAQDMSMSRRSACRKRRRLKSYALRYKVEELLRCGLSPQQISCRLKADNNGQCVISYEAIYQWVHRDVLYLTQYLLRSKGKRRKYYNSKHKPKIPNRVSICERPEGRRIGDWESDLLVKHKGGAVLQSCVDRGSRLVTLNRLSKKSCYENRDVLIKTLGQYKCSSITYDNGPENMLQEEVNEELKCKSYFCAPYHSWEKGSIENRNGVIRRYLPKGTDFAMISEEVIKQVENSINNTPMKCLNWLTPIEAYSGKTEKDIMKLAKKIVHPKIIKEQTQKVALTP